MRDAPLAASEARRNLIPWEVESLALRGENGPGLRSQRERFHLKIVKRS